MEILLREGIDTRITLAGKLDFANAPVLMDVLTSLKGKAINTILFECKDLFYVSSAGIRAILFAQQKIAPGISIIMEDVCDDVVETLDICGLSDFIRFTVSS